MKLLQNLPNTPYVNDKLTQTNDIFYILTTVDPKILRCNNV